MFLIDLENLRSGSYRAGGTLEVSELGFKNEADFNFSGPLGLDLRISTTDKLTFYVSGQVRFRVSGECRRCLKAVFQHQTTEVKGVFAFPEALEKLNLSEEEQETEGIFPLEQDEKQIDLTGLVRECVVLDYPHYLLCSDDCKGLCPNCGADLNLEPCNCEQKSIDLRWEKLLKLNKNE
ncbi:MAG TPA: DUF177 domain-containing protein [archaeon]|nr:DUF177 domain-containing protein [archaeon]